MIDTKELRERRAKLITDAQALAKKAVDEKRSNTAEETAQIDKMLGDEASLKGEIDRFEKLNAAETSLTESRSTIGREGNGDVTPTVDEKKRAEQALEAWRSYLINGREDMPQDLCRSLTLSGTSGYTAPALAQSNYIEVLRNYTDIRQMPVTVIPTAQGNDIPWPTFDDTANSGANKDEAADVGNAADPTIGQIALKAYLTTSGILKVSRQFLQDSVVPVEQYINDAIAKRIGVRQNVNFTTGTGVNGAQGLITGIPAGQLITLANGHSTGLGIGADAATKAQDLQDNLNSVIHKVKKVYRQRGKTGFMIADTTAQHLKTYVDSTGRGLWQPALTADQPDLLMGWPVWINDDMDGLAASKKAVVFGNYSLFYIRDVGSVAVDRLIERYAEYLLIGFNGYHRSDSRMMDGNGFAALVTSAA